MEQKQIHVIRSTITIHAFVLLLSVCLSICLLVRLSACLSVCLSVFLCNVQGVPQKMSFSDFLALTDVFWGF